MAKKGQKTAKSTKTAVAKATSQQKTKPTPKYIYFIPKLLLIIALSIVAVFIIQKKYTPPPAGHSTVTLSPPSIAQGETTSNDEATEIIADFIIPESTYIKPKEEVLGFNEETYLNQDIANTLTSEESAALVQANNEYLDKLSNHIKYLEQKIQKLEEHVYTDRSVIEKEYRAILSLALNLDKKVQTGESYNREIILLQLETDDIFVNGKIADISDFAISGTYTTIELNQEFNKTKKAISNALQEEISSNSPFAEALNGFISIQRKYKIPPSIANQLNLIQNSLTKNDLKAAQEHLILLPPKYQNQATNFSNRLKETILIRESVNDILKYLDV